MRFSLTNLRAGIAHLQGCDPVLNEVILQVGDCTLRPKRDRFARLVRAIISQQISTSAARSIYQRLTAAFPGEQFCPEQILLHTPEELRTFGVSPQKAGYLLDLCEKVASGTVNLSTLGRYSNEFVIEQLTAIKGIGHWTAQMFLMFSLGRLDVFPFGDLGIRNAIRQLYGYEELPGKSECEEVAEIWKPYSTIASWYCWRSLEVGTE